MRKILDGAMLAVLVGGLLAMWSPGAAHANPNQNAARLATAGRALMRRRRSGLNGDEEEMEWQPHAVASPTLTLVDADGTSIGGQLQAYADAARVPTLAGTLIVQQTNVPCPVACSQGPGNEVLDPDGSLEFPTPAATYGPAITWAVPGVSEYQFYFELGHQFDWAYLTNDDRQTFATMWRDPTGEWWDSVRVLNGGGEDGLERVFATDYASCAMGYVPDAAAEPSNPEQVCELIDTIGQRVGAHMPPPLPPVAGSVSIVPLAEPVVQPVKKHDGRVRHVHTRRKGRYARVERNRNDGHTAVVG